MIAINLRCERLTRAWHAPSRQHLQFANQSLRFALTLAVSTMLAMPIGLIANEPTREQLDQFERDVRPLLVEHCLACHGAQKQQGNLRLDSREAIQKGNESGPAVLAGNPRGSRLLQVLRYSNDDIQMPPKGKLPPDAIAKFEAWIQQGAAVPGGTMSVDAAGAAATGRPHWAFQPIHRPSVPAVASMGQVASPVDAFISQSLEAKQLTLSPPADRATFIRRVTFDLIGLPPSYDDVQQFVADADPLAEAKLVDRLLASPAYGQRWARFWLDLARYADSKGYVFTDEPRYPFAYTYRDYVVRAFNSDLPFDRFVREQLAADKLDLGDDNSPLAALGFLTVGRRFLNNPHDIIDDRIDVVSRGFMGLTVGCARCHDHKFDPVPTDDYYSLYGVFASSQEPKELPLIGKLEHTQAYEKFAAELAKREQELASLEQRIRDDVRQELRLRVQDALFESARGDRPATSSVPGFREVRRKVVERWTAYLAKTKEPRHPVWHIWHELGGTPDAEFPAKVEAVAHQLRSNGETPLANAVIQDRFLKSSPKNLAELCIIYGDAFAAATTAWQEALKANGELKALPDAALEEIRQVVYADGSPAVVNDDDVKQIATRKERDERRKIERRIEEWKVKSPGSPARAMVMIDQPNPYNPKVFIRGNAGRQGKPVPRQFLAVASTKERKPFTQGSGRLELADAVLDASNPLTARVIVNRLWQHHFGHGLVRTPSDFGIRGEAPTHPELLDYLASDFVANGWSIKRFHRAVLLSATYRQASLDRPDCKLVDSENRLLWTMPRRRLELEALRDSWLAAADLLDPSLEGRPFETLMDPNVGRRSIYAFVNRNDLPNAFRTFDFADTDASTAERPQTTVPQQGLFGLNSPFIIAVARRLATQVESHADPADRVRHLFRRTLSRDPATDEIAWSLEVASIPPTPDKLPPWVQLAQALVLTNEFLYVD